MNKYVIMLVMSAGVAGVMWWQNNNIEKLELKNTNLQIQVDISEQVVKSYATNIDNLVIKTEEVQKVLVEQNNRSQLILADVNKKKKVFETHDLDTLATKKAGLLELRVNKATIRVFEQIEKETIAFKEDNK